MNGLHGLGRAETVADAFDATEDMPEDIGLSTDVELEGDPYEDPDLRAFAEQLGRDLQEQEV